MLPLGSIGPELIGGATLAALAIPEVMGYTKIAGTPVVTGLYTLILPLAFFALFGSSRHLVVGADSATAAIMAAGLVGIVAVGSPEYMAYAGVLALMTGAILIVARLVRLGFLADFLSKTVLIGFLTGVGIQVAMGQIGGMFGVPETGSNTVAKFVNALSNLGQTNVETLLVSVGVLVVIVGSGFVSKKIPGALIAVVGSIALSAALDLSAKGVAILGPVPSGLPKLGLPTGITASNLGSLTATAFSLFLVILAQSAATSRAYAMKYNDPFSENVDLVGLGLANAAAGFSGTFVVNGSPTKTEMLDGAGGRTQLASLVTVGIVVIVLLFLSKPLQYMPEAVLGVGRLPDRPAPGQDRGDGRDLQGAHRGVRRGRHHRRRRGRGRGRAGHPARHRALSPGARRAQLPAVGPRAVREPTGRWRALPSHARGDGSRSRPSPGLTVYRFGANLYYANANRFTEEIMSLADAADPPLRWLCLVGRRHQRRRLQRGGDPPPGARGAPRPGGDPGVRERRGRGQEGTRPLRPDQGDRRGRTSSTASRTPTTPSPAWDRIVSRTAASADTRRGGPNVPPSGGAKLKDPGPLTFTALLQEAGRGGAFIEFPLDVQELFGTKGRIPIRLTFGGVPYRGSLVQYAGKRMVGIPKAVRDAAGVAPGENADVVLWLDVEERTVEAPPDLVEALASDDLAVVGWNRFSYTHQREYVQAIEAAKRPETRAKRIAEAVAGARNNAGSGKR